MMDPVTYFILILVIYTFICMCVGAGLALLWVKSNQRRPQ